MFIYCLDLRTSLFEIFLNKEYFVIEQSFISKLFINKYINVFYGMSFSFYYICIVQSFVICFSSSVNLLCVLKAFILI